MTVSNPPDGNASPVTWATASDQQRQLWLLQMEADYCAGIKPTRLIGKECGGVSHTFVNKLAKERGWERDLTAKIRAKAEAKVSKAAVSTDDAKARAATETQVVEANATLQYQVRMAHRKDIARGRRLWDTLAAELEATGLTREQVEQVLALQGPEVTARQRDAARQVLGRLTSTGARISNFNTLVHALERLVKLERQAFGIEGGDGEGVNPADNPAHPAGYVPGHSRGLTDAERAIRLARLMKMDPQLAAMALPPAPPAAAAGPAAVPVPPGRE